MFNDRTATDQTFIEGTTVYDANGDKVGTIHDVDAQGGYLVVEKGLLFKKDLYIPVDAVTRRDDDGVYLRYTKDELDQPSFQAPPVADTTMGRTAGSTSPTWNDNREAAAQGYYTNTGTADTVPGSTTDASGATTWRGSTTDQATGDIEMAVYEEELVAGTRSVEEGRVRVHKDVVEEEQTVNVPLQRERVTVDRVPLSGDMSATAPEDAFTKRDIDVPVMGEEPVVNKQVRGVEEVRIHKDAVTDDRQVGDTVRKERVVTDGVDDTSQATTTTGMDRTSR